MFADTANIEIRAGKGGDGRLSFRHEKFRAMGGPDGGNGGRGGDVVFLVDNNAHTLSHYRTARLIQAGDGGSGGENRRHGKNGEDTIVKVPAGTQVWEGEEVLADLTAVGQQQVLAKGGRGGFGNAHFTSSVRQAPRTAELGELGERHKLRLELKLVADVGLVGLPNAGKSTFLSVVSNAKPEIADYAFTTLVPNLGMVEHRGDGFLVADIPGLIEGASAGKGLGDDFLRHVERTAVLLHLVDGLGADPAADYRTITAELAAYGHGLADKPRLVALTKTEGLAPADLAAKVKALTKAAGQPVHAVSAQAHQGVTELLDAALPFIQAARAEREQAAAEADVPVIDEAALPDLWHVEAESGPVPGQPTTWRVTGEQIEGFARRTNFDQDEAVERLRDIMRRQGIARELRRLGALDGDIVLIADRELAWLA
ncbi:MAG TPA: GTPase ObgE [Candidatus Saccharimonas sp.]|nr:GTPase ObgE [Candidatus Saccharimonas sp.]